MQLVARILILAAMAAASCGGKSAAPKAPPPPREIEVLAVKAGTVRETSEYLGSLLSRATVNVLPQVSGYVRAIRVRPGDRVDKGAVLLELDAREQTAALESARAQVSSAASGLELARQTLTRTEALYREGLVNAQELERARAALASAEASRKTASAQASQRRVQLQYHAVRAPFAGTVGDVLVRIGDFAGGTAVLTTLAQADVLEVNVAVPADRARGIRPGTAIELVDVPTPEAPPFETEVYFVAPQADPRTQLVDVKAVFRNTMGLRPSELVRARVVFGSRQAIEVPALAIVRQGGQPFVFTVVDKDGAAIVQRRPVTLGPLGESAYVVEKGLSPGDRIAVSSIQALRDGARVRPRPAGAAAPPAAAAENTERGRTP